MDDFKCPNCDTTLSCTYEKCPMCGHIVEFPEVTHEYSCTNTGWPPDEEPSDYINRIISKTNDAGEITGDSIENTLEQRGTRYGEFDSHAQLSQTLQAVFIQHVEKYNSESEFTPYQMEALSLIFHKIARIGNGDPHYDDSWRDIAGYAQLVVDLLNKK